MSSVYGKNLKLSLFGESHGEAMGAVLDGFPPGFKVNEGKISIDLMRRSASGRYGSGRDEADKLRIQSGLENGYTLGSPISFLFENEDVRTEDYDHMNNILRPGHGDYTAQLRYGIKAKSGGGHMSGRLTAPLTAAGSLCKQYLEAKFQIKFITKTVEFCGEKLGKPVDPTTEESAEINLLYEKVKMIDDSCGAVLKTIVNNVPPGLGSPVFGNVESKISQILFGIPGLKGISFGLGFDIASLKGSEANDSFFIDSDRSIKTETNNAGGILGGISNGMPLVINTAFKPTPTIGIPQKTVDTYNMKDVWFTGKGRHDISYSLRVSPVIEAAVSIAILEMILEKDGYSK